MRAALYAFLHELIDADAERLCGAAHGERSADRANAHNGVRVPIDTGVNTGGEREVLGVQVADDEMTAAWRGFLASLVERGLTGVRMGVSDAHPGLCAAIRGVRNGTTWQRCYVHFVRELLGRVPRTSSGLVAAALRNVFQQTSRANAHEAMTRVIETIEPEWPQVAERVRDAEDDLLACFDLPEAHWRQIRSTNPLERLNEELRRRTRVVGIVPSSASVLRLVGNHVAGRSSAVSRRRRALAASGGAPRVAASAVRTPDKAPQTPNNHVRGPDTRVWTSGKGVRIAD